MSKHKMSRPERMDFFRVFPAHLLTDEDYESLTCTQWGAVFLLMLHQWAKGGTLPDDRHKLAYLTRCSEAELTDLLEKWPKLQAVEGQEGRVGIPYLVREWNQVQTFYLEQQERSSKGVEARKKASQGSTTGLPWDHPAVTHGLPSGSPLGQPTGDPVGPVSEDQLRDLLGESYTSFTQIRDAFGPTKFSPVDDLRVFLDACLTTSHEVIAANAETYITQVKAEHEGSTRYAKKFSTWIAAGCHTVQTKKPAPKPKSTFAAQAEARAARQMAEMGGSALAAEKAAKTNPTTHVNGVAR